MRISKTSIFTGTLATILGISTIALKDNFQQKDISLKNQQEQIFLLKKTLTAEQDLVGLLNEKSTDDGNSFIRAGGYNILSGNYQRANKLADLACDYFESCDSSNGGATDYKIGMKKFADQYRELNKQ